MKKKIFSKREYFTAFVLTILIFVLGIYIGNQIASVKLEQVNFLEKDLELQTLGVEIKYDLLTEAECDNPTSFNNSILTLELRELGNKLTFMESRLGQDNPNVLRLKEYYHLLEIKHWQFLERYNQECNKTFNVILFFYEKDKECPTCSEQGEILTYLHRKYATFNTYSFDASISNPALNTLKELYNIETSPSIVVGGNTYNTFLSKNQLISVLREEDYIE